ncbi:elongation factor-like GTPase 1 isoform X1 [Iris pallida]|uniref:Elongation factor-like GTPase 1 isoform X1 n=1 Tax=Iris pallida TaxID=29817 RepID=A0AAX6FGN8_IRIPA|nr:elongation factor-like GTPase 1 isoform X1 [Iris pallida]
MLDESGDILGDVVEGKSVKKKITLQPCLSHDDGDSVTALKKRIIDSLESELESSYDKERVEKYKSLFLQYLQIILSLGPRHVGPNIFLVPDSKTADVINSNIGQKGFLVRGLCHVSKRIEFLDVADADEPINHSNTEESVGGIESLHAEADGNKSSIIFGFQLDTAAGPLCDEPMWGLAFIVEPYIFSGNSENIHQANQYAVFSGQVMTTVKEACRLVVLQSKPRLVEEMYFYELNTPTEYLGSMYAVLARRRARVLKEEMQEGSPLFTVYAYVPVAESFRFADELRRWTSGASSALLVLIYWEVLPEDPFFVSKTEEEIEEFGDGSSVHPNMARKLMNSVRRRKGLPMEEKVDQHAIKQRTLASKV